MAKFPLTYAKIKKVWDGSQNPLELLNPGEIKAAELYVSIAHTPKLRPGTLDLSKRVSFSRLFREHFGFELDKDIKKSLFQNPAWLAYVKLLQEQTKETVLAKLEQGAMNAYTDYVWSRETAKSEGDYKEVRLGASDYLDRIGATKKAPENTAPTVTIVLKSSNFAHADVLKQLPAIEIEDAEIVDG